MRRILLLAIFALTLLGVSFYGYAQQQGDATCPTLVEQALHAIDNNCTSLNRNTACYGYNTVSATFTEPTTPSFFSQPSDRAGLVNLKNIAASPLDTALEQWGIALMSVQANLPDTLPGQNAVFMLLGDTQVENAVAPDQAFGGGATIDVTTGIAAGLFYLPDTQSRIVGAIDPNAVLPADAISPDGAWVRVVSDGVPGWVTREVLTAQGNLDTLPVLAPAGQTPMQSFYLRTSITGTQCTEAPDSLVVQGPQSLTIDINANGADIRLGSTIALRIITITPELRALFAPYYPDIDQVTVLLELVVIDGHALLNAGTPEEIVVDEGYRTLRCLSPSENLGLDGLENDREVFAGCPWLPPEYWRTEDFETYGALEGVTLNYVIHLPDRNPPTATPSSTPTPRPVIIVYPTLTPSNTAIPTFTDTVIPFDILTDTPTHTATTAPTSTDTATTAPTSTDTATTVPTSTDTSTPITPTSTDTPVTPEPPIF